MMLNVFLFELKFKTLTLINCYHLNRFMIDPNIS